ncbi:hypothetical protein HDU98_000837, partial [Podochytrium sp. JEL0797]
MSTTKRTSKRSSVVTRHQTVRGYDNAHSTSTAPVFQVLKATARTVTLTWMFHPENTPPHGTPIQIVKAEGTDPQFSRCYEGVEDYHVVENLKPETVYRFKMRIWDKGVHDFGSEYVEVSATTTDESKIVKVQLKLYRAVAENNVEQFVELMDENRTEINIEMRDKNGKTLLM